jgi:hypothetical protein
MNWNHFPRGLFIMIKSKKSAVPKIRRTRKEGSELRLIHIDNFKNEVCEIYDLLIGAGMEPVEAIRKTRSTLKAINYPKATYDVVMASLRASGRLRKDAHEKARNDAEE